MHLMMVAPSLRAAAACALLGLAAAGPKTILQPPGAAIDRDDCEPHRCSQQRLLPHLPRFSAPAR